MKILSAALLLVACSAYQLQAAACNGEADSKVCTNRKSCVHCKVGGTCGKCK